MIECKIEEPALDITPELARSAYNVLREYCKQHEDCYEYCVLYDICGDALVLPPNYWPEIAEEKEHPEWKERMMRVFDRRQ